MNNSLSFRYKFPLLVSLLVPVFLGILALGVISCGGPANNSDLPKTVPVETQEPKGPDYFQELTEKSPALKKAIYRNGEEKLYYVILESLGGGAGVIDFDKDGLLDLVIPGGGDYAGPDKKQIIGYPTKIFRNKGAWTFEEVTDKVLPKQPLFYSHGVAVCDYDRDGWPDLLVTGYGRIVLYRNVEKDGQRQLVDVTEQAGLLKKEHFWATSAAFGDLDGDGFPELYVCQYVDWSWENNPKCPGYHLGAERDICSPKQFNAKQHALYKNNGKGGFLEVTREAGLRVESDPENKPGKYDNQAYCGKGLGVIMVDIDDDQKPDIYVANDTTDNFLYLNKSQPGKIQMKEVGEELGVAMDMNRIPMGSMGVDAADVDGGGLPSLWCTNFENELHSLYTPIRSPKGTLFSYSTPRAGLSAIGQIYVGWGTGFLDLDNDGWMDLVISNGHVMRHPANKNVAQKPVLFLNRGETARGKFKVTTDQGGPYFRQAHYGRGLVVADLDNDGRPDLLFSHVNEPISVLKNVYPTKNKWLGIHLAGQDAADVVGAKVVFQLGDRKLTQFQKGGGSYASSRDPRMIFGLGSSAKAGKLTVYWPAGEPKVEHWDSLETNLYHKLVQGTGKKE